METIRAGEFVSLPIEQAEEPVFDYRRKPALISFLSVYLLCFVLAYLLTAYSEGISTYITDQIQTRFGMESSLPLWNIPFGNALAVPFLLYGIVKGIWHMMSFYEITSSDIRVTTGCLSRTEHYYMVPDFSAISFRQSLLETPFGAGSLILTNMKNGKRLIIKGVHDVQYMVDVLRPRLKKY